MADCHCSLHIAVEVCFKRKYAIRRLQLSTLQEQQQGPQVSNAPVESYLALLGI